MNRTAFGNRAHFDWEKKAMDEAASFEEELEATSKRGQTFLDKLLFNEAETVYRELLRLCQTPPSCYVPLPVASRRQAAIDKATVSAISGLAETYLRQSRFVSTDQSSGLAQWMRLMIQSLSLHRDVIELCRRATRTSGLSGTDGQPFLGKFFKDASSLSTSRTKVIEDTLVSTIKQQLLSMNGASCYQTNRNDDWLVNVLSRCSESSTGTDNEETLSEASIGSLSSSSMSSLVAVGTELNGGTVDNMPERTHRRRINFDRIQNAIKQLVTDASSDVRSQYGHLLTTGAATQSLLQRRVASELMVRLARTGRQGAELKDLLQDSITYEEEWQEERNNVDPDLEPALSPQLSCPSQPTAADVDDDSDDCESNADDDYETLFIECPSNRIESLGHVIVRSSDVTDNDVDRTLPTTVNGACAESGSAVVEDADSMYTSRASNCVTILGLNKFGDGLFEGIVTVWKSYLSSADSEPEEQHPSPSPQAPTPPFRLATFEEVSPLTERGRVFRWLEAGERSASLSTDTTSADSLLSSEKLSQTIGFLSLEVANKLRDDAHFREASDVYKYVLGIFEDHPISGTVDDVRGRCPQSKVVAELLRDIGIVKCNLGEMTAGCQLMEESAMLYEWRPVTGKPDSTPSDLIKVADVWYQLGNMFFTDELRNDSLLDHVMEMTQTALMGGGSPESQPEAEDREEIDSSDTESVGDGTDDEKSYSVCTHEAITCYQKALAILDRYHQASVRLGNKEMNGDVAELFAGTLSRLADCYVLTGQLDRAIASYERALPCFRQAVAGGSAELGRPMLTLNSHVLTQLATVNFLVCKYMRARVLYETAVMLRHHLGVEGPSGSMESAWLHTMYGLTCGILGRDHQCVVWCLRAFAGYVSALRGRIISVEPVRRWFVVETLYALGRSYGVVEDGATKAVHYLTVAKNLALAAPEDQMNVEQTVEVLEALAEACEAVGDTDGAARNQADAEELMVAVYGNSEPVVQARDARAGRTTVTAGKTVTQDPETTNSKDAGTSEEVIHDSVKSMISQLGLNDNGKADSADVMNGCSTLDAVSIREAERDVQEAVCQAGSSAVAALSTNNKERAQPPTGGSSSQHQRDTERRPELRENNGRPSDKERTYNDKALAASKSEHAADRTYKASAQQGSTNSELPRPEFQLRDRDTSDRNVANQTRDTRQTKQFESQSMKTGSSLAREDPGSTSRSSRRTAGDELLRQSNSDNSTPHRSTFANQQSSSGAFNTGPRGTGVKSNPNEVSDRLSSHVNGNLGHSYSMRSENGKNEEAEETEEWITIEEEVETPPEVIAAILAKNRATIQ